MKRQMFGLATPMLIASAAIPLVAYAKVYLIETDALHAIFPSVKFIKKLIALSSDDIQKIEKKSGERVKEKLVAAWVGPAREVILVDQVLGKHEFITYAVGITPKKTVQSIEILEYRETFGQQVQGEAWRKQFVGKNSSAHLKVNDDIVNISGATLSSVHVTAGVRRLLHTFEVISERL